MSRRFEQRELALVLALLAVAALVRLPGVFSRAIWYDESISLVTSAGNAQPAWPAEPVRAAEVQRFFTGQADLGHVVDEVRRFDVHPPLYYWALGQWRNTFGASLESARGFSLLCSLAAILALYLLLRSARLKGALPMTLVYALSTGAAHSGHEARAYALASALLLSAAWLVYRAFQLASDAGQTAGLCALGAAVAGGLAFHVNYLSIFPVATLFGWLAIATWRRSRAIAIAAPLLAAAIVGLGATTLSQQMGSRTGQLAGFIGWLPELAVLLRVNTQMIGIPLNSGAPWLATLAAMGLFLFLLGLTAYQLLRHWREVDRAFWILIAGLATAPSAGVLLLDLAFDKRLHVSRYVNFAGPALALLVSYGLVTLLRSPRRAIGLAALAGLLAIQASNLNWGLELCPNSEFGSQSRSLAHLIHSTSSPHHAVVMADGDDPSGNVGALIYELHPDVVVLRYGKGADLDELVARIAPFDDLWIVASADGGTRKEETELLRRLETSGRYRGILRYGGAAHLAKIDPASAAGEGTLALEESHRKPEQGG
ncbi:MAG: glycosyltransferase family 39 protein [Acidobacteriota bacterium]